MFVSVVTQGSFITLWLCVQLLAGPNAIAQEFESLWDPFNSPLCEGAVTEWRSSSSKFLMVLEEKELTPIVYGSLTSGSLSFVLQDSTVRKRIEFLFDIRDRLQGASYSVFCSDSIEAARHISDFSEALLNGEFIEISRSLELRSGIANCGSETLNIDYGINLGGAVVFFISFLLSDGSRQ